MALLVVEVPEEVDVELAQASINEQIRALNDAFRTHHLAIGPALAAPASRGVTVLNPRSSLETARPQPHGERVEPRAQRR